jgi:hypothetical protein
MIPAQFEERHEIEINFKEKFNIINNSKNNNNYFNHQNYYNHNNYVKPIAVQEQSADKTAPSGIDGNVSKTLATTGQHYIKSTATILVSKKSKPKVKYP